MRTASTLAVRSLGGLAARSLGGFAALAALLLGGFAAPAHAEPATWHATLQDGLDAAAKSGKPVLLVTGWKPKV